MKIENRIAAFKASKFEEAFEGFDFFDEIEFAKHQSDKGEEIAEWIEELLECDSFFLFSIPLLDMEEIEDQRMSDLFDNPEDWIILFDNIKHEKNYIGAICIFNKKDLQNCFNALKGNHFIYDMEDIHINIPFGKR